MKSVGSVFATCDFEIWNKIYWSFGDERLKVFDGLIMIAESSYL